MENPVDEYMQEEVFRDKIATVDASGKRIWIYPKKPKGKFYDYRKYVSYILLAVLFGLPFIQWNGKPFVLFNILETKFIILGVYFAPQDFHLFVIAMLIFMIFIALFTVIYGVLMVVCKVYYSTKILWRWLTILYEENQEVDYKKQEKEKDQIAVTDALHARLEDLPVQQI